MVVKEGYKQTEVGVIPSEWEVKKIREVCQLINGRGFKPFEWKTNGLPIIRIQNLNGSQDYNYYQGIYDKKLEVDNGQLLFAWSGSRGTSFGPHIWNGSKGLLNYHTWKIVINEYEISKPFFTYALKKLTKFIEDNAHGASALVHTQKWEMEGFEFPSPSNQIEQTAIATALSDADALITGLEKLIAKKRNIKQGAMQQLLQPKEGWEVKNLGGIANFYKGKGLPKSQINENGKFKCIHYGELFTKHKEYIKEVISYTNETENLFYSISNDVLMPTSDVTPNGLATASCIKESGVILGGDVLVIRVCEKILDGIFLSYFITKNREQVMKLVSGSTVYHLSGSDMKNLEINSPSIEEQTRIAKILIDMDAELTALEQKLEKYKKIKLGMMQELLTGRTRLVQV